MQVFRTMDFNKFKAIAQTLKEHDAVLHLRKTSKGETTIAYTHPFETPTGVMFHNGTIYGLGDKEISDTAELADILMDCEYDSVEDIRPLLETIIGNKINKLVFQQYDGTITIINEDLGMWEDGIWYSNDYHKKCSTSPTTEYEYNYEVDKPTIRVHKQTKKKEIWSTEKKNWVDYEEDEKEDETEEDYKDVIEQQAKDDVPFDVDEEGNVKKYTGDTYKVFVYGTLKRGYGNNALLSDAKYLGKAKTITNWLMIGDENMSFPYLLRPATQGEKGHQVEGEVYEVDETTLNMLDYLEGVPAHYRRVKTTITYIDETGEHDIVYVYVKTVVTKRDLEKEFIKKWSA